MSRNPLSIKPFQQQSKPLFALVLGASGAGKSTLLGTMPGRILYIYFRSDISGASFASSSSPDKVFPYLTDPRVTELGVDYSDDEAIADLLATVSNPALKDSYDSIACDGLPALEELLMRSPAIAEQSLSKKGAIDSFAKDRNVSLKMVALVLALVEQRETHGLNVAVTSLARVNTDDAGFTNITVKLRGFNTIETLLPSFPTIIFTGRDNTTRSHFIDFTAKVSKRKEDENGNEVAVAAFSTRIEGLRLENTPQRISKSENLSLQFILDLQHGKVKIKPKKEAE
jgi:hypothetical protein